MPTDSIPIYIAILIVLLCLSAFFSATETAYSSLNRTRLKSQLENGSNSVKLAYKLTENYDKLLFTILIGNNIVNIAAATISTLLFATFITDDNLSATVSTLVLTIVVLIFGEITPKTLAKEFPEKFACMVSYIINIFIYILYPLNIVFTGWKLLLVKIFKFKPSEAITEEELLTYVEEAKQGGTLDNDEKQLISSAIEFNDCEVGDILVPRVNVVAIDINTPMNDIRDIFLENGFSRLPVYQNKIDTIIGMIHEKDFYSALVKNNTNIDSIITSIALATEHMQISTLLKTLQKDKVHMAVVIDEYGGTLGLVTLEDILEELVGEIYDEHDEVVNYFNKCDENTYIVDGNADASDFFELFELHGDDEFDSNTVSGWIVETCGNIPNINYTFDFNNLTITVTKRNLRKVLEVKVEINNTLEEDN